MCPMSNDPSYAGDLVNPQEEVETVFGESSLHSAVSAPSPQNSSHIAI